jgi:hypothetical protein
MACRGRLWGGVGAILLSIPVLAGPAPAAYPRGCYAMWPYYRPLPGTVLENPGLVGVYLQFVWSDIEPEDGRFNWTKLDARMAEAEGAGLATVLSIRADLTHAPRWLLDDPRVRKVTLIGTNRYRDTFGKTAALPVFWDSTYHERRLRFIRAVARRYAERPSLAAVTVAFANVDTDDWGFPHEDAREIARLLNVRYDNQQAWVQAGYTTEAIERVGREVIDTTARAFPRQCLKLPIGIHGRALEGEKVLRDILQYARARYEGRFFIQVSRLDTGVPEARDPQIGTARPYSRYDLYRFVNEWSPHCGLQMFGAATLGDRDSCRQNQGQKPCPAAPVLERSLAIAASYKPAFIEVWAEDCSNPELAPLFAPVTHALGGRPRATRAPRPRE